MLSCELQKRQWAIPAEPELFSQIVICLFCMRISVISCPSVCKTSYDGESTKFADLANNKKYLFSFSRLNFKS